MKIVLGLVTVYYKCCHNSQCELVFSSKSFSLSTPTGNTDSPSIRSCFVFGLVQYFDKCTSYNILGVSDIECFSSPLLPCLTTDFETAFSLRYALRPKKIL